MFNGVLLVAIIATWILKVTSLPKLYYVFLIYSIQKVLIVKTHFNIFLGDVKQGIRSSSYSFFSDVLPLAKIAGFTLFLLQSLALHLSTLLDSGLFKPPSSSNQSSLSLLPLAPSRSHLIVLAFSCHSLQDPEQPSKHIVIPPQHISIPFSSICCR